MKWWTWFKPKTIFLWGGVYFGGSQGVAQRPSNSCGTNGNEGCMPLEYRLTFSGICPSRWESDSDLDCKRTPLGQCGWLPGGNLQRVGIFEERYLRRVFPLVLCTSYFGWKNVSGQGGNRGSDSSTQKLSGGGRSGTLSNLFFWRIKKQARSGMFFYDERLVDYDGPHGASCYDITRAKQ